VGDLTYIANKQKGDIPEFPFGIVYTFELVLPLQCLCIIYSEIFCKWIAVCKRKHLPAELQYLLRRMSFRVHVLPLHRRKKKKEKRL